MLSNLKISRVNLNNLLSKSKNKKQRISTELTQTRGDASLAAAYDPQKLETEKLLAPCMPKANNASNGPFRMILPPPNVTGDLHLGHALMATVQDVICRQHRQLGYDVEWIPGTDHAGIATQVIVEKKLLKERGLTRHDMGRMPFLLEVWKWKHKKGNSIVHDLVKLGCSLNWDREYFTMDENQANAVNVAFIRLFEEGLITRQNSLVNWSCALESAISDIEVETLEIKEPTRLSVPGHEEKVEFGRLFEIKYRFSDIDDEIVVATTRPETMLGDVAVAVHPEDERYKVYRNMDKATLWHPFRNEEIPLIFDVNVDPGFGTGAVKITPAHDKTDFEIGKHHLLKPISVFTEEGRIAEEFQDFHSLPRFEARKLVLSALEHLDLLGETRAHAMTLPLCSRSKDVVEYMLRPQWFLYCQSMANEALSELRSGRLQIIPEDFEVNWERWLSDCHDWCISRQLWWGHRIPAYQAEDVEGNTCWVAAQSEVEAMGKAKEKLGKKVKKLERDEDVLDTWFSSALLPFSAFGWPSPEYKLAYPLDLMQTGHDILFFWVARMVMLGLRLTGESPFQKILLNGIVCDAHGRKMSKSLGNVITPDQVIKGATLQSLEANLESSHKMGILNKEELDKSIKGVRKMFPMGIERCGTDALRFTLCSYNIKNHFINFDVNECHTNKLFLNKIWQATRFTCGAAKKLNLYLNQIESLENVQLGRWDHWILSRLASTLAAVQQAHEQYNLHMATSALKYFFYNNFCDVYVETTKMPINLGTPDGYIHCATLATCLSWGIQALSVYTPFIAEELLKYLPQNVRLNLRLHYDATVEREIDDILNVCQQVRQLRSIHKISKKHDPCALLFVQTPEALQLFNSHLQQMSALTLTNEVDVELVTQQELKEKRKEHILFSTAGHLCSFALQVNKSFDESLLVSRSAVNYKKLERLQNELDRYRTRLQSEGFRRAATEKVQQKHIERIQELELEIENMKN